MVHGDERVDDYEWLRDAAYPEVKDPEILRYLTAENAYLEQALAPVATLREALYQELRGRVAEDDDSVPFLKGGYYYQTRYRQGREYPELVRWAAPAPERAAESGPAATASDRVKSDKLTDGAFRQATEPVQSQSEKLTEGAGSAAVQPMGSLAAAPPEQVEQLLDLNQLAEGHEYLDLGDFSVSPDQALFAYSLDLTGSERHEVHLMRAGVGPLEDRIPNTQGSLVWSADGEWLFYAELDAQLRPSRVYRHRVGTPREADVLVYEETDPAFWLGIGQTQDEAFIVVATSDKQTSEVRLIPSHAPTEEPLVVAPRRAGHEYDVEHHDGQLIIRTNDTHTNFRIVTASVQAPGEASWRPLIAPSDACYLRAVLPLRRHLVILEREAGLPHVRVREVASGAEHRITFPDPVYTVSFGENPEFDRQVVRLQYQSLVAPPSVVDYDLERRSLTTLKVQRIPSGYDVSELASERRFATAADGVQVPISLVYHRDSPPTPSSPVYLYVYGSYGMSLDPYFSANRLSLLRRGFVFAIAHVRGGSTMGRAWYEDGKLMKKENTFTDIIRAVEHLAEAGYTSLGRVTLSGGSAGGMAVGAVINRAPGHFHAAVASVPFVDVMNTMLDSSLPLTPPEYTEWGNPELDPEVYRYIQGYSPYDNVTAQPYPHLLVTAGISDPRVTYWEPAKWVAKLRQLKTDDHLLLLHTNMSAGHGGASGRFEALKELAREYAFLLWVYQHPDAVSA